jgi:hypothetical protein
LYVVSLSVYPSLQNTFTNAEKLLASAREFAESLEGDATDINHLVENLDLRTKYFAERVAHRRRVLAHAVHFFGLHEQVRRTEEK